MGRSDGDRFRDRGKVTTMNTDSKFTILSTRAPLVEVDGDGPYYMLPGGIAVADGARTTATVDLAARPVRKFRVETAQTIRTAVIVTDSPYGAFAQLRRCVEPEQPRRWWHSLVADRWPRLSGFLRRHARSVLALWFVLIDDGGEACRWQDIDDAPTNQVLARGGDVVVVTFVNAVDAHA
jgi:hypothetical protein